MKDKYPIKSELGQGGMATVYLAHDIKFQTNVAIKVLNKEYVHNDNIRKRFIAEARNMFKMSHPNIIKVTDLIDDGDTVAFVMEYIEGETLKEYLERKGKLSDAEIKNLFSQMLEAVGYVHEQNLVHRDIKPSNFMINQKGQVKLLDFGIAKTTDVTSSEYTQTGTGIQMGTPLYMSPEQVKSSKEVGPSSDIYSLGVVLWQMLMGKKPYDSNTLSSPEIQVSILKEPLPITNTQWDTIIQKATAKEVLNRYETCFEIKKALSKVSEEEEKTILSNAAEKTIIESSIIFVKEAEVRKSKTLVESTESSKHHSKKTTNIKKYWLLFLVIVPILLFSIYQYSFKSEETPPVEEMCFLEPFENINKLYGYKCKDSIIIAATYTATDDFKDGKARVSRNDSLFYIDESGKMIEFLGFVENKIEEIEIGDQVWMKFNLNISSFRNGEPIKEAKTDEEWEEAGRNKQPAWCYYNNDPANGKKYGKLYNWYAVNDSRGLGPKGWHIPSNYEWGRQLIDYLGGMDGLAGGKMKSTGTMLWKSPNEAATNSSGFTALPGGFRGRGGAFNDVGLIGYWWSSSEDNSSNAWLRLLSYDSGDPFLNILSKKFGFSVRCVRDL
jgi:uncharacterized protein (TIGR02145 family)